MIQSIKTQILINLNYIERTMKEYIHLSENLKAVNAAFYTKSCVGFLLVLNMSVIVSCNINRVYENRLNDKEEAQKVVNEFYEHLMDKQFDKTYPLLADSFYYYTDKAALLNMYNFIWDTCGNITDTSQVAWETFVLEGT